MKPLCDFIYSFFKGAAITFLIFVGIVAVMFIAFLHSNKDQDTMKKLCEKNPAYDFCDEVLDNIDYE